MAVPTATWAALASWETADAAADKPLLASQTIPASPLYAKLVDQNSTGVGDITTWVDRSDASYPSRRCYDGYPHYDNRSDGVTVDDVWYYSFDAGTDGFPDFDCAFLIGHNFGTLGLPGGEGVRLEIADDNDFSTNLRTLHDFANPSDDDRLATLDLHHTGSVPLRYSDVRYMRLRVSNFGAGNIIPQMGELIVGRRRQLHHMPVMPFDPTSLHDEKARTRSAGGVTHETEFHRRRFDLRVGVREHEDTYINNLISWFEESSGPLVWVYKPNSAPNAWHLVTKSTDDFDFPNQGWSERRGEVLAVEQGPERFFLSQE